MVRIKIYVMVIVQLIVGFFAVDKICASQDDDQLQERRDNRLAQICSSELRKLVNDSIAQVNDVDQARMINPKTVGSMAYDKIRNNLIVALANKKQSEIACDSWIYCLQIPCIAIFTSLSNSGHDMINDRSRYYCMTTINHAKSLLDEGIVKKEV